MSFTPRTKQILKVMLQQNQTISIKNLADQVGVSKRTIQRELEYIDSSLKKYQIHFHSRTGVGVWLEGNEEEKLRLLQDITTGYTYDVSNREDRRKRLVLEILKNKGLKKLFYYSSKFQVSEATISADLEAVEEWLNRQGLFVVRKPGSGVEIEGSEASYRKAIRTFIDENMDTRVLREAYESDDNVRESCDELSQSKIGQILNNDILKRVVNCLMEMEDPRVMSLTENSYIGLVIHIAIAVNRIVKNEIIESDTRWTEEVLQGEDYELAQKIVCELEKEFDIDIPPLEISYICLHIKGAKHERIAWEGQKSAGRENRELQQLINEMIDVFDAENSFLLKQDDEFIQGLLAHLQPTFIRILYDMQIANPVLEDIKKGYPDIYERCIRVANVLAEWIGKPVPEEEIGFLTVHFGAAVVRLEGRKEEVRNVSMGIVCSSGIGISRLMSSKLEKAFHDRVVITTYGKKDITPYIIAKTDFFVSSISLENVDAPVLYVNPLLSEEDMEQVRKMVYRYERMPRKDKEVTGFSQQLEEINLVAAQINAVIKYMEFFKVDHYITFDELLIAIGEKMSPYRDLGEIIRDDLQKREMIGSQIFAEFGFALLHTRTRGVMRPSFTICMTKDLQSFRDPYFKNISVVFIMLLPVDDRVRINSEILGYISTILIEDMAFMDTVLKGNKEEIRGALSLHLKKFFNKYLSKTT